MVLYCVIVIARRLWPTAVSVDLNLAMLGSKAMVFLLLVMSSAVDFAWSRDSR